MTATARPRRDVADHALVMRLDAFLTEERRGGLRGSCDGYRAALPPHRAAVLDHQRVVDMATKVVGVGSIGTRCLIVGLESRNGTCGRRRRDRGRQGRGGSVRPATLR